MKEVSFDNAEVGLYPIKLGLPNKAFFIQNQVKDL